MFAWTPRATGHVALGDPSPLLTHLAGEFAPQIAGLWAAPHAVFVTADAPRRHLLCLRLAQADAPGPVLETILHGPLKAAVAAVMEQPPAGLRRALEHMGEIAWPRQAYLKLLALLAHPQVAKVLRHASTIEAEQVAALDALPVPMLDGGGGRLGFDLKQARLVGEIYAGLASRDGEQAAQAACRRWGAAPSAKDALAMMQEDLAPHLPPPPFIGTRRLRPIASREQMRDAALRYRNCLRNYITAAARGHSAFFEWLGDPGAVVQIRRDDLFGWRLDQARLVDNASVPPATRAAICEELRGMGVHIGRADWQLRDALEDALEPPSALPSVEAAIAQVFTGD